MRPGYAHLPTLLGELRATLPLAGLRQGHYLMSQRGSVHSHGMTDVDGDTMATIQDVKMIEAVGASPRGWGPSPRAYNGGGVNQGNGRKRKGWLTDDTAAVSVQCHTCTCTVCNGTGGGCVEVEVATATTDAACVCLRVFYMYRLRSSRVTVVERVV